MRADPLLAEELNTFYGRFDRNGGATLPINASGSSRQSSDVDHVITVSEDEVRRELRRVNIRKAAGPDGITGRVLRSCADQLAGLFTSIFNESLATSVIPTSFKKSVIIPVPKNSKPSCLNDYRPVALTSIVMKVFERLLKKHICSSIPATLDPLQFAYRPNRSTDDAISQVLHSSLTHIDSKNGNYVRLLFIDYSSAFNTIVPSKLAVKLSDLGLNTTLCDWIQDFLTGRPQVVKMGQFTSNSITLNVGAPQGCVLSPLLYSLYTHDCVSSHSSTSIVKFADDTVVLGLISNNDETAYLGEVERLTSWCQDKVCVQRWRSYGFGTTWGWVINDRIFIFGPLRMWFKLSEQAHICLCFITKVISDSKQWMLWCSRPFFFFSMYICRHTSARLNLATCQVCKSKWRVLRHCIWTCRVYL